MSNYGSGKEMEKMVEILIDVNTTHDAEELFEQYIETFGNIVSAEMKGTTEKRVEFELTLTNKLGQKMIIKTGLTAGYVGTGPNGTIRVLRKAGFVFDDELVHSHEFFKISK